MNDEGLASALDFKESAHAYFPTQYLNAQRARSRGVSVSLSCPSNCREKGRMLYATT